MFGPSEVWTCLVVTALSLGGLAPYPVPFPDGLTGKPALVLTVPPDRVEQELRVATPTEYIYGTADQIVRR